MSGNPSQNLENLIQERNDKKRSDLKQKLEETLRLIRAKTKTKGESGGVDDLEPQPMADGAFEKLACHQVWEYVLEYITEPLDVTNMYFTCETFNAFWREQRYLKIVNILRSRDNTWSWNKTLLSLRTTSKLWKRVVDLALFHSIFSGPSWFLTLNLPIYGCSVTRVEDDESEFIDRAMSLFPLPIDHNGNRYRSSENFLLFRNWFVDEYNKFRNLNSSFHKKFQQFLKLHGKHIWFFQHSVQRKPDMGEIYKQLRNMLQLMPNLKALVLDSVLRKIDLFNQYPIQNFQEILLQFPYPVLDSLQYLHCTYEEEPVFLTEVFKKCLNLRTVIYRHHQEATEEMAFALRKLTLERYEGHMEGGWGPRVITATIPPKWPLRKLSIRLANDCCTASVFFPAVNNFRETLEHLEVKECAITMDTRSISLDLPKLRVLNVLCLSSSTGIMGWDELLLLTSLEKVVVVEWEMEDEDGDVDVDEDDDEDEDEDPQVKMQTFMRKVEMEMSNVWKIFPNLKHFEIVRNLVIYERPSSLE